MTGYDFLFWLIVLSFDGLLLIVDNSHNLGLVGEVQPHVCVSSGVSFKLAVLLSLQMSFLDYSTASKEES